MISDELKPCPFPLCKGKAVLQHGTETVMRKDSDLAELREYSKVRCIKCGCETGALTEEEVLELWNTRAEDKAALQKAYEAGQDSAHWDGAGSIFFDHETYEQYLSTLDAEDKQEGEG